MDFAWAHAFVRQHAATSERAAGYYNHNYVVDHAGETFLVRIPIANSDSMDLRLIPEVEALRFLEARQFPAPRLLYVAPDATFAVHSFVQGSVVDASFRYDVVPDWMPLALAEQMALLHTFHDHGLAHYCRAVGASPDTQGFFRSLIQHVQGIYRQFYDEFAPYFRRLQMPQDPFLQVTRQISLLQPRRFVLSHCDIHRKNLIADFDRCSLTILDWELVLIADPAYDITVHFHKMGYTPEQEERFLIRYLSALGPEPWGESLRGQLWIYRSLERVKSAIVDCVRYVKDLRDPSLSHELRLDYAMRYGLKLQRAFGVWELDPPVQILDPSSLLALLSDTGAAAGGGS